MKKFFSAVLGLLLCATAAQAQMGGPHATGQKNNEQLVNVLGDDFTLYYLEEELGATINTYLDQNEPPMLHHVSVEPAAPRPGDDINITAEIRNNPINTDSRTIGVTLYYSYDGGETWEIEEMSDEIAEGKLWSATIPSMGGTGVLHYYFLAEDDAGNVYAEVPETDVVWASERDEGFLVSLNDENRIYKIVPNDIDILSVSLAYDGELFYFKTVVEGDISAGTITPFYVNLYSVGFFFPDSPGGMGPKPDYVLTHAQHAQFIGFPIIGLLDVDKNLSEIFSADARYFSQRNALYMRLKKSVFDKHEYDAIRVVFGTANGTHPMPLEIETKDISCFINLAPGGHSLDIR